MNKEIAVLFCTKNSIYKNDSRLDCFDIERDARSYAGNLPIIAHPPCRAWARLRGLAKPRADEKELAFFAVNIVRKNGGVLEHPESSQLFDAAGMPNPLNCAPGQTDEYGGFTLPIQQFWFGHRARKNTWLYICGINPREIPVIPMVLGKASYTVSNSSRSKKWKKEINRSEREATPQGLADWLVDLCLCIARSKEVKP